MAIQHITNLWQHIAHLVITQYRESSNLLALVSKVVGQFQEIEDAAFKLANFADIEQATGEWLDLIGKLRNIKRNLGENDESYKNRLRIAFKQSSAGTPNNVIANARDISGDPAPQYLDEVDAVFFVYTPEGEQLRRKLVNSLAPAGVLGLPGAGIDVGEDCLLADANGKIILMVAEDVNIDSGDALMTEDDDYLTTETDDTLVLE